MELKEAQLAVKDGEMWLRAAKLLKDDGLFSKSLYSLEMAIEISIKGVLIALHKNYPKRHDVSDVLEQTITSNEKTIPKEFVERMPQMLSTFRSLLRWRNVAGYDFGEESNIEISKEMVLQKFDEIQYYIKLCGDAVSEISER